MPKQSTNRHAVNRELLKVIMAEENLDKKLEAIRLYIQFNPLAKLKLKTPKNQEIKSHKKKITLLGTPIPASNAKID